MKFHQVLQQLNKFRSTSLVKSSGIYTVSSSINAAIPIILLPILTRRLSPADYGIVSMFQLSVSVIFVFISMNLDGAIQRRYFVKDAVDFPAFVGSCFLLVGLSSLIVSGVFFSCINFIHAITKIPELWLKYIVLVAICQFFTSIILIIFQITIQPVKYGVFQISQSLINFGLTLLFIIILNKTWDGRIDSIIIAGILFALLSIFLLIKANQIRFNFKKNDFRNALKFGIPLIPHAIGSMLFTGIDRLFLSNLVSLEQTGNYSVAYQIGAVIGLLTISFNNAYIPWLFQNLNKDDVNIKRKIVKFTYLYFTSLIIGAIILILIFPTIISIFVGHSFNNIDTYSVFIVFGFVFLGMYYMVTNYIVYIQKTSILAIVTISVGVLKIPITYFAIIWFGPVGASISYCFTYLIFFIVVWFISNHVYPMPWNIKKIFINI